ncbi:hypothetical protein RhiirA5_413944 [Rhizophagus irregularis]|uniref:Uncharacterized protein n=3 Tax=Rhizophagus irregularis TaxID=588596 RepID=U9TR56_RHIID|nr:hypothetical protein GLOIN_2v1764872 [Rhizophagus irregularis DAOM 181602=DAOM 197198]EXX71809.1 hypothetical protein RirG_075240 [Rhizophagus irregularis DAOM 197198w]PKC10740.1 hypothetical protein RhiirA5_413944 [Rhizophagus irregularis]PKC71819.1 hypothetical protein RhiirA1_453089 [Rhizophagus irregularis]PKY24112.1 hypothetical protein RhiirB3_438549 [Rhizophagus irregularis]POG80090.1 hypothetical protein GLOIN_2v1764872 [Rhizophagus irregularis DAOM 181602=DAOM 197198]|eukprot:XP_025186956.1 hypothetical protein GLOIN_2v1764872 [Rhizophagus irregularis DAOM 181602=DAOM 197198]
MHSELDLLRQENAKLLAENAKIKAKNVRLRQAIKDNVVKLTKLEQSDKEKEIQITSQSSDIPLPDKDHSHLPH